MFVNRCKKCKQVKSIADFHEREDMPGSLYAWCIDCMEKEGRSTDYPPITERGSGVIHPNYSSLRVGYDDGTIQ